MTAARTRSKRTNRNSKSRNNKTRTSNSKGQGGRTVDPRLQARRRSVARRDGLRRLWIVGGITALASLAIAAIAVSNSTWLDIEQVTVAGADRSDPEQIVTASGIVVGEPLVEIDPSASADAIEGVPWVASANVDRSWGGDVVIEVTERVGVVALASGSRFAVVDRSGQQLEIVEHRPDGFFPVVGTEASGVPGDPVEDAAMPVVAFAQGVTPAVADVTEQIVIEDGQLMIDLSTGGRANFGDERALADKLVALETVLVRVDLTCVDVIDVRVPEAPTVSRERLIGADEEPKEGLGGC